MTVPEAHLDEEGASGSGYPFEVLLPALEEPIFRQAISDFWHIRTQQGEAATTEAHGAGRAAVTGGAQMLGFIQTITQHLVAVGVPANTVHVTRALTPLPGFFRATKQWDLVVVSEGKLLAALELKSQVGPSFGNNFNNRTEEALGSAEDLWTAYREGKFGDQPQPWLGWLMVLDYVPGSTRPVRVDQPHFPVFPEFVGTSYAARYELLCRQLIRERKYDAACLLLTNASWAANEQNYHEPAADLSGQVFLRTLLGHVLGA